MPRFGRHSKEQIDTLAPALRWVLEEAIRHIDFRVRQGHRGQQEQERLYRQGKSKVHWPYSRHNVAPSEAVDIDPWPLDFEDTDRYYFLAGWVMAVAASMQIRLRWGGDWDGDHDLAEEGFRDLGHFELLAYEPH